MTYLAEWRHAIDRTKRFGLLVPQHEIDVEKTWLDVAAQEKFPSAIHDAMGELSPEEVALQCIAIHYRLQPVIQKWLDCEVLYTIGWVDFQSSEGMYRFDDSFVQNRLEHGHPSKQVPIHTWLTLPSMEIIDVALGTTMSVVQKNPEMMGGVISGKADSLRGMAYKPMLVGADFLVQTKLIQRFSIFEF